MAKASEQFEQLPSGLGSRSTPDINDEFLEKLGFYRKHIANDSTCLFRAVSEQQHGVQIRHEKVRKLCVEYMGQNQQRFSKNIESNFQFYLETMAQPGIFGTLLELEALAMYYNVNVEIYEPLTAGRWFVRFEKAKTTWKLFRGQNNHFDSVYSIDNMREAKTERISRMYQPVFKVGMICLCQIDGSFKVCRIVIIDQDSEIFFVQINNASRLTCVRMEELMHYHPHKLGNRHFLRTQTGNVTESPRNVPPAPVSEAPAGLDTSAQMFMPMTMPGLTQSEIVNWQTGGKLVHWRPHWLNSATLLAPPIAMYPAPTHMATQQDLDLAMHQQQKAHEQLTHQQILNDQQQQQQLHLQSQLQQFQLPMLASYQHNSNCPAHYWRYETVVPVETTQQQQQAMGHESISGAGLAQNMHGGNDYMPSAADHSNSATIETTATMPIPYMLVSENALVYPGNIISH